MTMTEATKICSRRIFKAIIWSLIFEVISVCIFLMALHFRLGDPFSWVTYTIATILSPVTWIFFMPVIMCTVVCGYLYGKELMRPVPKISNRINYIRRFLNIHNMLLALSLIVLSIFSSWFYVSTSVEDYTSVVTTHCSDSDKKCLVDGNVYLFIGSVFVGFYVYLTEFAFDTNLEYPVVQQLKLIQMKEEFLNLLRKSIIRSLWPVFLFSISYTIVGGALREYLAGILGAETKIDSYFQFVGFIFLFYMCFLTFLFMFSVTSTKYLLALHLTERQVFPVTKSDYCKVKINLSEAMAMQQLPVIQNLAYLDLKLLAEKDLARRQQLYILSQPGGHPYNWNAVVSECVKLIKSYNECINLACREMLGETHIVSTPAQKCEILTTPLPKNNISIRNLSMTSVSDSYMRETVATDENISISEVFKSYWHQVSEYLYKSSVVSYFFGVIPESRLHWALSQAHPVIWATQGLAFLTTASFKEDEFGISLKDLPEVITCLVNLNKSIIKIPKFVVQKRAQFTQARSIKIMQSLRSALERSLYKVIITYDLYLRDIRLSSEIFQELHQLQLQLEC